ncbi:DNA methyltransferase [Streptomyces sioyaensis]|uniref:DNA methyltransferase n=1 Tax=Streptomyces sioyaensis TaxID=67364 RepID=UPI0037B076A2
MGHNDAGGASRFFPVFRYEAKAPASGRPRGEDGTVHPTVKPLGLIRWLVRLVTPPGGIVLDPFTGSGTTLKVASLRRGHLARRTHICPENGPKARRRSGRLVCRKCDARAARTRCA